MTNESQNFQNSQNSKKSPKIKKPAGPIRWNAIVPFTLFILLVGIYFHFLFDQNMKSLLEFVGYKAVGAEVNIGKLETSFLNAKIDIQKIELTNAEAPDLNSLEIGNIRFSMLWDGLLRARIVINEVAVEKIAFGTKRSHRGKVKPPEPPAPPSTGPSVGEVVKDEAIDFLQDEYNENVLGDIAVLLKGGNANEEFQKIQNKLPSKAMMKTLDEKFKGKQVEWNTKLKTLPQGPEIQALGDRLGKVKTKDFKTPQELEASVKEFDSIFKSADEKIKKIQGTGSELQNDLKEIDTSLKALDKQIKEDIKTLETHFRIPKIDAKVLAKTLFGKYMGPYLAKFNHYKSLAYKYIPPNLLKKKQKDASGSGGKDGDDLAIAVKPHPREKGVSYEFGRVGGYPMFWLKKTIVSSKAGTGPGAGDIQGSITDITSNQAIIGRPTILDIKGNFPESHISGFESLIKFDTRKEQSEIDYEMGVASYPIEAKSLVDSGDVHLAIASANGNLKCTGSLVGFKELKLSIVNNFKDIKYGIDAKDKTVEQVMKNVFGEVRMAEVRADANGTLPKVNVALVSNIGEYLEKAFNKELDSRIKELKLRVQRTIDEEVGKKRAELEKQINAAKAQVEREVKKVQDQIEGQKKQVEDKTNQAKKDAENKAKSQLEDEGKKKLDELKKKLGF